MVKVLAVLATFAAASTAAEVEIESYWSCFGEHLQVLAEVSPRWPTADPDPIGWVDVEVWVDKSGRVQSANLVFSSLDAVFADVSLRAATEWEFNVSDLTDSRCGRITFSFALPEE